MLASLAGVLELNWFRWQAAFCNKGLVSLCVAPKDRRVGVRDISERHAQAVPSVDVVTVHNNICND